MVYYSTKFFEAKKMVAFYNLRISIFEKSELNRASSRVNLVYDAINNCFRDLERNSRRKEIVMSTVFHIGAALSGRL